MRKNPVLKISKITNSLVRLFFVLFFQMNRELIVNDFFQNYTKPEDVFNFYGACIDRFHCHATKK